MESSNRNAGNRFIQHFDWVFFLLVLLICAIGLATLYSSTSHSHIEVFYKQCIFLGGGVGLAFFLSLLDYRLYEYFAYPFYFLCLLLIALVPFIGKTVAGSQRWIGVGPVQLQPSELAKVAVILVLARFYSQAKRSVSGGYGFRDLMPVFLLAGIPMLLVFLQPDLGTALMIGFVAFSIVYFCQLKTKTLITMVTLVIVAVPIAYNFVLREYQRDRVRTFLNPERDPLGEGYHSIQSMIAVGSGQVFGKGYLQGTQSKLEFLPKHHTDFIFSAFAEEWGFLGCSAVLTLFVLLAFLGIDIARKSKDKFGAILAIGCVALILWHVIVNIGMEIGLLPVVGVTLPFFSYGGSSMLTNMMAVGMLLSVSLRRHIF